jgi:hypothetical protein
MCYMGGLVDQYARVVYLVGAREPGFARALGAVPVPTFAQALSQAERHVGKNPRMLVVPRLTTVQVHVRAANG